MYLFFYVTSFMFVVILTSVSLVCYCQNENLNFDSLSIQEKHLIFSKIKSKTDTPFTMLGKSVMEYSMNHDSIWRMRKFQFPKNIAKSTFKSMNLKRPYLTATDKLKRGNQFVKFNGGYLNYNAGYRNFVDTPLLENNVAQHTLNGNFAFTVADLPLQVSYLLRRTNSDYFRNLNDVRIVIDIQNLHQNIYKRSVNEFIKKVDLLRDSASNVISQNLQKKYDQDLTAFTAIFNDQSLVQAKELINVKELTWDMTIPDSLAKIKSDSIRQEASEYLSLYKKSIEELNRLKYLADSIKAIYDNSLMQVKNIKNVISGNNFNYGHYRKMLQDSLMKKSNLKLLSNKDRWLLGIRSFGLGRTSINSSELTAKNLEIKGINFEYNSWYYFSFTAGIVDYRFRDFNIQNPTRPKQYFSMGRIGIGDINRSFVIASFFHGQKQLYQNNSGTHKNILLTSGISIEAKYQLNRYNYVKAEIAESSAPDFRLYPQSKKSNWSLSDKSNKAYSISALLYSPKMQAKVQGVYKYIGSNFQSFSNFQNTSQSNIWNIRAEKYFFKKELRVIATIKNNEYSNPYLNQTYMSNTIFKSVQGVFRKKRWPVISAGYIPISQLTNIGGEVSENRFNSLNGTLYHTYKVGLLRTSSTIVYTKFYNSEADSLFIYFNAKNLLINQIFYLENYIAAINITRSTNKDYELNVMDENFQFTLWKRNTFLLGVKINNLNKLYTKVGHYGNIRFELKNKTAMSIQWEMGYIPGTKELLVRNNVGGIQLSKSF